MRPTIPPSILHFSSERQEKFREAVSFGLKQGLKTDLEKREEMCLVYFWFQVIIGFWLKDIRACFFLAL